MVHRDVPFNSCERAAREDSQKWKQILRTRQEVYHPLQEVSRLDRGKLLQAKLEALLVMLKIVNIISIVRIYMSPRYLIFS